MSGFYNTTGEVFADIYGGLGSDYQAVLLQDSPLRADYSEMPDTTSTPAPEADPGLSGDVLPPEGEWQQTMPHELLEANPVIQGDYTDYTDYGPIRQPAPEEPIALPSPEADGPDMA